MPTPKKYFHDRVVLLFLTVNTFLALLCGVLILLRLNNRVNGYIVQYRLNLGINAFKTGSTIDLVAFIIFALTILILHTILSMRAYGIHRQFAVGILSLGTLLITLSIIISNALLALR